MIQKGLAFESSDLFVILSKTFLMSLAFTLSTQHYYLMSHRGIGVK